MVHLLLRTNCMVYREQETVINMSKYRIITNLALCQVASIL